MIVGIVAARGRRRASAFFWPRPLIELTLKDGTKCSARSWRARDPGAARQPARRAAPGPARQPRPLRARLPLDRRRPRSRRAAGPEDAVLVERQEYGPFYGFLVRRRGRRGRPRSPPPTRSVSRRSWNRLTKAARRRSSEIRAALEEGEIGGVNYALDEKRREIRGWLERQGDSESRPPNARARSAGRRSSRSEYAALRERVDALIAENGKTTVIFADADGNREGDPVAEPWSRSSGRTSLGFFGKLGVYVSRSGSSSAGEPREANSEGGVFPAIFGTVMMMILMSAGGRAVRRARGALPARVREAGAARPRRAHRGEQPRRRAHDRVRRLRPRLLRLPRSAARSTSSSSRRSCPTRPSDGRDPLGVADAGAADAPGRHRGDRGGARGRAARRCAKARYARGATKWQTIRRIVLPARCRAS